MATRELLRSLTETWSARPGTPVEAIAAGGVDVATRVRAGEGFDVVVLAANVIDELVADGRLLPPRVDVVRSGIGIAVRAGGPRPAVTSEDEVREAVRSARTISCSTGPSGTYLQKLFERWDLIDEIRARIIVPPPGVPVGSLVADGKVELGFQQLSELIGVSGIHVLGPLPPAIQSLTTFAGAVRSSPEVAQARALLDFLGSRAHSDLRGRHGMERD
jgi:molybdate transport system substrate-binding protein